METPPADDGKRGGSKAASTLRASLIATIAAIAIAAASYYVFYRRQADYYAGRDLRVISTVAAQLGGSVTMYARLFRDGALPPPDDKPAEGTIHRGLTETDHGWHLLLKDESRHQVQVPIDDVFRPLFARRVSTTFDMVLVADKEGNVVYRFRTPPPASSLLSSDEDPFDEDETGLSAEIARRVRATNRERKERESGATMAIRRLGVLEERTGGLIQHEYAALKPASLLDATARKTVRVGDEEYLLFSQPYTFATGPESVEKGPKPLIVCGLVGAQRFENSARAVSASVVFIALGVALLVLCCWPFLRIALIDSSEELRIADVALIVICTAFGACVLVLAVLDVFAYRALNRRADAELETFSGTIVDGFGKNIGCAMDVLKEAETTLPPAAPDGVASNVALPFPPEMERSIAGYPYIDAIAWIDRAGAQRVRYTPKGGGRLSPVASRQFFRNALAERTWSVNQQPYVVEWIRSRATGDVRSVVAKKTKRPDLPVIAMWTELIDVSDAVRPPGVQIAIIEENGEVVFHSDGERIGFENFFAETERNRALRSAVLARRTTPVEASYWGEDHSMYVRPLNGSRWTLVTFRAKRLARVLNVEGALLTILLLLWAAAPYLILYIVTLIVAPRYRAPSVWPDPSRRGDYLRLCFIYLGLLILSCLIVSVLEPWSSFDAVVVIPTIAVLSTYLVLHRTGQPRRFAVAAALWLIANAALVTVLLTHEIDDDRFFSAWPNTVRAALAAAAIAVAALTFSLTSASGLRQHVERFRANVPLRYPTIYRLCGVLLLLLCTALPVAAFFNISQHFQSELLVKYGQLRAAADLERRIDHIEAINASNGAATAESFDVKNALGSVPWELAVNGNAAHRCPSANGAVTASSGNWITKLVPTLYEDSAAIRPLFGTGAADGLWRWCMDQDSITLHRKVRFDVAVSDKLWPGRGKPPEDQQIIITSPRDPAEAGGGGASSLPAMLLCAIAVGAIFWYAAGFIASRVLLIDIVAPHWMTRQPLSPSLGDHIFLVRRNRAIDDDPLRKGPPFFDVSFEAMARDGSWDAMLARLDTSAAGQNIRVLDFEYGIGVDAVSLEKLKWLERLLALPDRTVIVLSTFTPAFVLAVPAPSDAPADYLPRWRALLGRFAVVTVEELELRYEEWQRQQNFRTRSLLALGEPKNWLEKETAYNPFLLRLREELDPTADREHLLDEIAERAETYYTGLWSSCRDDEKLLLYQLAHHGLANGRNRRTLRRLIARGLVRRNPNLELFSETFRLFVIAAAKREDLVRRARAEHGGSTWDSLRIPFFVVIVSFLLLLFATQKDLMTTTTAIATALTTGLPIIMKLVGVFADKRLGPADASGK